MRALRQDAATIPEALGGDGTRPISAADLERGDYEREQEGTYARVARDVAAGGPIRLDDAEGPTLAIVVGLDVAMMVRQATGPTWAVAAACDLDTLPAEDVPATVDRVDLWVAAADRPAAERCAARLATPRREVVILTPPSGAPSWADVHRRDGDAALWAAIGPAPAWRPGDAAAAGAGAQARPASRIITAEELLAESDSPITYLCDRILSPGAVTILCSPRGTGKSHVAHGISTALATGVRRAGTTGDRLRVLLVDRDNPRQVTRERLRRWRREGEPLVELHYLGRQDEIASLLDAAWWRALPVEEYAAMILDSLGSLLPGVQDKDTGAYSRGIATAIAIAERGPAVALLANPIKDASAIRGSGITSDRVEAVYELRDVTGWTPDGKGEHWFSALPEAGEAAFASRAARRKGATTFRLAFVVSKFRSGVEPDPFAIELRLPAEGAWDLAEVTEELEEAHEAAREGEARDRRDRWQAARDGLAAYVRQRYDAGDPLPERSGEVTAEKWLKSEHGITRDPARRLIDGGRRGRGALWDRVGTGTRKSPHVLVPPGETWPRGAGADVSGGPGGEPGGVTDAGHPPESAPPEPLAAHGVSRSDSGGPCGSSPARIDPQKRPSTNDFRAGDSGGSADSLTTGDPADDDAAVIGEVR